MKAINKALGIVKGDHIVTAWAEYCSGPGWSNRIVHVIVCDENNKMRREYLQPEQQTAEVTRIFALSSAMQNAMICALERKDEK